MVDVYTYCVPLPGNIREAISPCADGGYTVYIREDMTYMEKLEAFRHAMKHIENNDFEKEDVQAIETAAHKKGL